MAWVDWAITAVFYVVLVAIGLYTGRLVKGVADFLVAGRAVRRYLGFATGSAADTGAASVVAGMEAVYRAGPGYLIHNLIGLLWGIFLGKTGFVIHRFRETGKDEKPPSQRLIAYVNLIE